MLQSGDRFFLVGLSFKKANIHTREAFSMNSQAIEALLTEYKLRFGEGIFAISTCNRTEIYGFAPSAQDFRDLFLTHSKGLSEDFDRVGYIKEDQEAIIHLFRVGSGLESQIVGDFQIIGQVKQGYQLAKKMDCGHPFLDRLVNLVIKSSKRIKNETGLSSGTTSLAYAAVQAIQKKWKAEASPPKILLFGAGKIGRATCDNLYRKFPSAEITLINRTQTRAEEIALKYPIEVAPIEDLSKVAKGADVIVVATGAETATLLPQHIGKDFDNKLLIDLSVPRNIDPSLGELEQTELIDVNGLAQAITLDLKKRKTEIPKAEQIVSEAQVEFDKWLETRRFAPMLNAIKENLQEIKSREIGRMKKDLPEDAQDQVDLLTDRIILKITRQVALHLTQNPESPEDSLRTIESIFSLREENKAS